MTLPLSPIDQVFTGRGSYPLEFVFAYERPIDPDRLAASLRSVLALFPAVSSRLVRLGPGGYGLEPSPEGCVFEAKDAAAGFAEVSARHVFLSPVETREGEPLARIRLSRTPDGGSVLGVSLSHAVVDGFSFFHFLASWSRLFHGRSASPPSDRRELLVPAATAPGARLGPVDVFEGSGLHWGDPRSAVRRSALRWDRRVLTKAELKALRQRAQEGVDVRLSHNDVVAAWLWQTYVPQWSRRAPDPLGFVHCPVDLRRVLPSLPPTYFGCAVALAVAAAPREELCEAPLGELALRVRRAVDAVDEARALGSLELLDRLRRQEGEGVFERVHVVHPRCGLLVTNLSRLPAREVEFDAGPPVAFDILTPAERCAVVLPAADGLDVRVCLPGGPPPAP